MADVVGVHGVFQYRFHDTIDELVAIWTSAMGPALGASEFALAYYSPLLHRGARQGDDGLAELDDFEAELVSEWLTAAGVPEAISQGRATRWIRDGLDWLSRHRASAAIAEHLVAKFFREVGTYLDPAAPERRLATQASVLATIKSESPTVVVAHSLGSVVTYEALWSAPEIEVETLITLGSPLALPVFFERLAPAEALSRSKPPNVRTWLNFADVGDVIAIPKPLRSFYSGLDVDEELEIHPFEFHRIVPYLQSTRVRELLGESLALGTS